MRRVVRKWKASTRRVHSRNISRDKSGNVLPMMSVGLLVLAALVGGGVDMSRAYKADRRLQAACDAGALAGRRAVTTHGFDSTVQSQANLYFHANFDDAQQQTHSTTFTPSSPDDGATVVGTATTTQNTVLMKIFGFKDFDLTVDCSASMGVGNSDIMFVLDNTGSMNCSPTDGNSPCNQNAATASKRITALKTSMINFYNTVHTSVSGGNARVRYGFVPFSSAVNVGALLNALDSSYIANSITVPSIQFVNWNATPINTWVTPGFTDSPTTYGSWSHVNNTTYGSGGSNPPSSCTTGLPADTAWADNGAPTYTTSYSIDTTTGHQIKTTGMHQSQTFTDYECRKSSGSWYRDKRTGTRDRRSDSYEERTSVVVTTNNVTFANAIRQMRTIDVSSYKTFSNTVPLPLGVRSSGTKTRFDSTSPVWPGCIQERATSNTGTFTFVSLATGITPAAATDLDIDAAPTNDASRWKVLWPQVVRDRDDQNTTYEAVVDDDGDGNITDEVADNTPSAYCPKAAQLLTEMDSTAFTTYVNAMTPTGSTYLDIGMLWGARLSSPTGIFSANVNEEPDNGSTVSRHVIFMTDGVMEPSDDITSSYGLERIERRVTDSTAMSDSARETQQTTRHSARMLAVCEAIKARGIRLWVISFGAGSVLTDNLINCATDGLASAFKADNAAQLDAKFQEIAKQVGELRIVQ